LWYKFDETPQWWAFIAKQIELGIVKCGKVTYDELAEGTDWLAEWCKTRKEIGMCVSPSKEVQECYNKIAEYAYKTANYRQAAKFLDGGDGWVIAHAMPNNNTVVSHEARYSTKTGIKVPNVCAVFGIRCISIFDLNTVLKYKAADYMV
jgi:hypothetical protein